MDDHYERLFQGYRQAWVDLNGDGVPDAPQDSGFASNMAIMPDGMPTGVHDPVLWPDSMPSPHVAARDMLGEVSGAYGFGRGLKNVMDGYSESAPGRMAGGAAEAGLSLLPYSGPLARAAFSTLPRAMGTGFAIGSAPVFGSGFAGNANAAEAAPAPSGQPVPNLGAANNEALVTQYATDRAQLMAQISQAKQERDANLPRGRAPNAQSDPKYTAADNRVRELEAKASGLDRRIERLQFEGSPEYKLQIEKQKLQDDADQKLKLSQTPFREKNPEISQLLPAIGLSAAFGVPFVGKALGRMIYPSAAERMGQEVTAGRNALAQNNPSEMAVNRETLAARLASGPDKAATPMSFNALSQTAWNGVKEPLTLGVAGAGASAEAAMYPDQYDAANLPDGPAREAARKRALDPVNYLERGFMGGLAANSGSKLGQIITPQAKPDYAAARGIVNAIDKRGAAATAEAGIARNATEAATARAAQFTAEEQAALQQAYARAAQDRTAGAPNLPGRDVVPQQGVASATQQPTNGPQPQQPQVQPVNPPIQPPNQPPRQREPSVRGASYSPEMRQFNRGVYADAIEGGQSVDTASILRQMEGSGNFQSLPSRKVVSDRLKTTDDIVQELRRNGVPVTRQSIMALAEKYGGAATLGLAPIVFGNALSGGSYAGDQQPNALARY